MSKVICHFCSKGEPYFLLGMCDSCGNTYDSCFNCATQKYDLDSTKLVPRAQRRSLVCKKCIRSKNIESIIKNQ